MITPETITDIRAALDVATPGEWDNDPALQCIWSHDDGKHTDLFVADVDRIENANLICFLRNYAPALLDEIERLRAELDRITNDRNNQLDRLRAAAGHTEILRARVKELETENEQQKWYVNHITEYRNASAELLEYIFPMPNTPCGDDDAIAAPRYAIQEIERLRDRVDGLEAEKKTWKNALEELTPGGSEFIDNPKRCADFVRAKIETMWKVIASKSRRVAELEAERDEQNAVLREATQKLVELNVKNAVLKEKLRTAEDFNENYTVIDDIGPLPKCFRCRHQLSMAFRGPDAPCYHCGIDKGYPKFKADKP